MKKPLLILMCSLIFIQCTQVIDSEDNTGGPRPKPGAMPVRTEADHYLSGKWEFENLYVEYSDDVDQKSQVKWRNEQIERRKNSYLEFYQDGKYLFLMNDQSSFAMAGDFNFHNDSLTFHYKNYKGIDTVQTCNVEILNEKRLVLDWVKPQNNLNYVNITYTKTKAEER